MKSLLNALQDGRLVELPDDDKENSLRYLAHLIEAIPELGGDLDLAEEVLAREAAANTGIGLGVACPHVRAKEGGELLCAVGWNPKGIDYGSKDGMKVYLVVMYYIPDSEKNIYLKEISALAGAVKKEGSIQAIAKAEDIASVREELLNWVSAAIEAGIPEAKARMVRLEARQAAAEAAPPEGLGMALDLMPVLILTMGENRHIALTQDPQLTLALEKDLSLTEKLNTQSQFAQGGYELIFRRSTPYDQGRTLSEYIAIRKKA